MVTDAVKRLRNVFAYGLLVVAALYFISGVSLLFKSEQDSGLSFAPRAASFGYLFTHPVLVLSLLAAVALAVGFGEASKSAKVVVLVALGIGSLSLLFALICWFSGFGADEGANGSLFGGVLGAGKIVGFFLGLAQLALLALAVFFAFTALQALPKASGSQAQWGQQQQPGYAPHQGYPSGQGYGQPPQGYASSWTPADPGYGSSQPPSSWSAGDYGGAVGATGALPYGEDQPAPQQGWAQPPVDQQSWGQPPGTQQSWAQPPVDQQSWGQPPAGQASWGRPSAEQQPWPEQSGQAASQWGQHPAGDGGGGEDSGGHDAPGQPQAPTPTGAHPADLPEQPADPDDQPPPEPSGWWRGPQR